jgi:lipocalin-like protein
MSRGADGKGDGRYRPGHIRVRRILWDTVNEKEGIVTHHLESALFPGDIGKSIKRRFAISGNTLTIQFNTTLRDGTPVTRTLVWARLK